MLENFKVDIQEIDKVGSFSKKEKDFRIKNLNYFNKIGFPNKKFEDWKFSDLREIVSKNFNKLEFKTIKTEKIRFKFITEFEHNYIFLVNGNYDSSDFKYEDKDKIKIEPFLNDNFFEIQDNNPLINLNHALSNKGYFLKIEDSYKLQKSIVIYNFYTNGLDESVINSRNMVKIGENSEAHIVEITINKSEKNFFNNVFENIILKKNAILKNIFIQEDTSKGYFHKYSTNKLSTKSKYSAFIFPSGLKFNKIDMEFNLEGEFSECNLQAASFIHKNDHQEIKTRINHLAPNCKSYQKVKKVLNADSKGVYQGKVFVKDIAQKTDAYQLSKAILLNETSEFDSKPELEIYADDVKCSHGSTSGNVDEESIFYLMSRGLNRQESVKLLVNGFLNDVIDSIKSNSLKNFVQSKLENQLNANKKH